MSRENAMGYTTRGLDAVRTGVYTVGMKSPTFSVRWPRQRIELAKRLAALHGTSVSGLLANLLHWAAIKQWPEAMGYPQFARKDEEAPRA